MSKYSQDEKDRALMQLREWLKPGMTVNCILRHKSRSGMSRSISLILSQGGNMGAVLELDYQASRALGESIDQKHGGIRMGGCGMDMGFALVYNLSRTLFPHGYGCVGEKCPSNDHSNGDRDYTVHHEPHGPTGPCGRCGHYGDDCKGAQHRHSDGGYALRHRWL